MNKQANLFLIVVLLLGWAFDFLFWEQPVGVNFAIFAGLCLLGGFLLLLRGGLRPASKSLWLIAPVVFFAVITFLRQEPLTLWLAYLFTAASMGLLALTYLGGRWPQYSLLDYGDKALHFAAGLFARPLDFLLQLSRDRAESGVQKRRLPVAPVVRGLAIAIPVVFIFGSLLSSADLVFNQKINDIIQDHLTLDDIFENIFRLLLILVWAYGLAGVFLNAATQSKDEKLHGEDRPVIKRFLGFTEAAIVLGSVAALFLAFVIIQFQYFFGGRANIGVEGFTFSEYARRGFYELVTVACLSLLLTLGLSALTNRETELQRRVYSGLSVGILAMVLVILLSAFYRLSLAMSWHGFSRLRLYPRVFLIWVGILFVAVVALEILRRERFFAFAALLAAFGFAISLNLVNVDASIAHHNVSRAVQGFHFNVNYLSSLSTDAIPALVDEFHNTALPVRVREGVGAALVCFTRSDAIARGSDVDWQSFNLSQWQSSRALDEVQDYLQGYQMNVEGWIVRVGTPHDMWYDCAVQN